MSGTATVAQLAAKWWVSQIHRLQNSDKEMQTGQFGYLNALNKYKIQEEYLVNFEKLLSKTIDEALREGKCLFLGTGLMAYGILAEAAEQAHINLRAFPVFSAMIVSSTGEIEVSNGYFEKFYILPV